MATLSSGVYRVDGADVHIGWIKTYDGAHSVLYLGVFDAKGIIGEWHSGAFALEPSRTGTSWETTIR